MRKLIKKSENTFLGLDCNFFFAGFSVYFSFQQLHLTIKFDRTKKKAFGLIVVYGFEKLK